MHDSSLETLAKELFAVIHKPSIVSQLLIQNPNILHFHDARGNALQAALRTTVNNENSALTILDYAESHHMINCNEDDINACPFYLAILKGYHNCLSIMVNTKQGKYIVEKHPHRVLLSAVHSGIPKMISQVLQYPPVQRVLNQPADSEGNSILHLAVMMKENSKQKTLDIVKSLLAHGVDPCLVNKNGKRASMMTKNELIWQYLRKCEYEREQQKSQTMSATINDLSQQNDSKESLIAQLMSENKRKEQFYNEKIIDLETCVEKIRLELTEEIKQRETLIESQKQEIKMLVKEKETFLKTMQLKSEEHIANIIQLHQTHAKEKESLQIQLESMAKNLADMVAGFQQTKMNMIGLQNEALKGFQSQQNTRFDNLQTDITVLQKTSIVHDQSIKETKDTLQAIVSAQDTKLAESTERQEQKFVQLEEEINTKLKILKQEQETKTSQLRNDHDDKINVLVQESESKITILKNEHDVKFQSIRTELGESFTSLKKHTDESILRKDKKDTEQFQDLTNKIANLETTTESRNERLTTATKTHNEQLLQLRQEIFETRDMVEKSSLDAEFKLADTNSKYEGEVTRIKDHLKSHDSQLQTHSDLISDLTGVVDANRGYTEQRTTILEQRISSTIVEIENTNTKLADHALRQQQDKMRVHEELERDRTFLLDYQDRMEKTQHQTEAKIQHVSEETSKNSLEIESLKENTDRRHKSLTDNLAHLEEKIEQVDSESKEMCKEIKDNISCNKKEDKRKFDTLFERVENSEYYQNEKIHEVVIEKLMEEKKKQLEQLEHSLLNSHHCIQ